MTNQIVQKLIYFNNKMDKQNDMLPQRFWDKVTISKTNFYNETPCWEWKAANSGKGGYGKFWYNKKREYAHRVAYEDKHGKIPKELDLDHRCRNTCCCNPLHLQSVSHKENCRQGLAGKINNNQSRKTHCPQGHEYSEENTYIVPSTNGRSCRTCHTVRQRQYIQRKNIKKEGLN